MPAGDDTRSNTKLEVRKLIPASPDRVFSAWTSADELLKWWGPKGVRCVSAAIDLQVGGQYCLENELADGTTVWIRGEFECVERPNIVVYTWIIDGGVQSPERVTVRFSPHEQGTEIILLHERILSSELREQHRHGWVGCLDGLVGLFEHDIPLQR